MGDNMTSNLRKRRKAIGLTLEEVAQAVGTTKATVMKLEKGQMQMTEIWMKRLAGPLQCQPSDFIAEEWPADVPVIGLVDGQDRLALYRPLPAAGMGEVTRYWEGLEVVERPPEGGYRQIIAVRVRCEDYGPLLPIDSLIYAADPIDSHFKKYLEQIVICVNEDGRVMLGKLKGSPKYGEFLLVSLVNSSEESIVLHWCAKVIFFKPM